MPTERLPIRRERRGRLNPDADLELWLGLAGPRHESAFASEEERRELWFKHRDRLLGTLPSSPGRRPQGWWDYEAPPTVRRLPYDRERLTL